MNIPLPVGTAWVSTTQAVVFPEAVRAIIGSAPVQRDFANSGDYVMAKIRWDRLYEAELNRLAVEVQDVLASNGLSSSISRGVVTVAPAPSVVSSCDHGGVVLVENKVTTEALNTSNSSFTTIKLTK